VIRGFFHPNSPNWPLPYLRAQVFLPNISTTWELVPFLIDTGSSDTSLHPSDARGLIGIATERLQDPSQWDSPLYQIGISGPCLYFPHPAWYALRHDDGSWQFIEDTISIAQLLPGQNDAIPSLLGWNIL
jgi:hypothetical protein